MFTRIRYFFEDVGYWFSDRFSLRRGGEQAPASTEDAATAGSNGSADAIAAPPQADGSRRQRRREQRTEKREARVAKRAAKAEAKGAKTAAAGAPSSPDSPFATAAPDLPAETEKTTELPSTAAPRKRRRPSLPSRPSLPKPRLPRPRFSRPTLSRPGRRGILIGAIVLVLGALVAVFLITDFEFGSDPEPAPAPQIVIEEEAPVPEEAPELGFPAFATKNTTRVAGADPVADAAGVALATSPATGGVEGPAAVTLVAVDDWPAAIAASSLVAEPVSAPILFSGPDEVPDLTLTALTALAPQGSSETGDAQLFSFGSALAPEGLRAEEVSGANPAELAAAAATLREELTGDKPEHIVLASSDRPEFAMPAAAWAARSGDPVLFVQSDSVPTPTLEALERLKDVPVYVLGPEPVVSEDVLEQIAEVTKAEPKRIGEDDAVSNAIAFARYSDGSFGWNISDPGHGMVLANATRPADAGAAAPLSASGKWGPLLLTDNADVLPAPLEGYLLDIKPGYVDDPTRAVYNHAWLIGNADAISVDVQAQVDELLELAQVESGRGGARFGPVPGQPDSEPEIEPDDPKNP